MAIDTYIWINTTLHDLPIKIYLKKMVGQHIKLIKFHNFYFSYQITETLPRRFQFFGKETLKIQKLAIDKEVLYLSFFLNFWWGILNRVENYYYYYYYMFPEVI